MDSRLMLKYRISPRKEVGMVIPGGMIGLGIRRTGTGGMTVEVMIEGTVIVVGIGLTIDDLVVEEGIGAEIEVGIEAEIEVEREEEIEEIIEEIQAEIQVVAVRKRDLMYKLSPELT
eukprot:TRINITY_DN5837_c0_g1_i1.p2 TRINITY_DN5837_c0_g1~~TRINITY_DN5837_c0_g1_i1.p2  ORF type:complete len:117 (-),score=21.86 TRINITY_DN5837_c0_g1_i1:51-401(-)